MDFANAPLEDMVAVGATGPDMVRVMVRSRQTGPVTLSWRPEGETGASGQASAVIEADNPTDNTCSLLAGDLAPMSGYSYEVTQDHDARVIGRGRFETAPRSAAQTPEKFSFAVMSCNQPFNSKGEVLEDGGLMLQASRRCMQHHHTKFALLVGDQMYSDFPEPLSLFNKKYFATVAPPDRGCIFECTPQEVRSIFQRRYRHFWNQEAWLRLQAEFPCLPILDDHDIVDNWGSVVAHQQQKWQSLGIGAGMAYFDYQGRRMHGDAQPNSFHYSFTYGNTAAFVMDLRTQRTAGVDGQLYSDDQQDDLETFLHQQTDKEVLLIVLSVPVVHLPRFLARLMAGLPFAGEDFSDRWSSGAHVRDRDRLLRILHAHQQRNPHQRLLLCSGDIHIGCAHLISWKDGTPDMLQLISSPITHQTSLPLQWASKAIIQLNKEISTRDGALRASIHTLQGTESWMHNPLGDLNMGLVEVETATPGARPTLRLLFYGHERGEPALRFDSGPI